MYILVIIFISVILEIDVIMIDVVELKLGFEDN